ncbi:TetR family transcriptional regulator [Mycolicibacterium agri]|uniref:TetR family transcriptional regulator n=1 Tax=Mycolicibacterium agri TaxID=36811 RepID=A0A7I9W6L0_MYCAG|nr:TetR family transcriptional regulator [Mycolicibacterium agri]
MRPYRGVQAADRQAERRSRLLNAGLDILGSDSDHAELTVRAVCKRSGLTARYFYESFADKDEFVVAVFDWVIADIAATTQAAVSAARPEEQTRAAMANIVSTIIDDPRIGRLLFSSQLANPALARKRIEATALMAMLSAQQAMSALQVPETDKLRATSYFVVGGVVQTIGSWLAGVITLTADQLVDQLSALLDQLADRKLYLD